MTFGRYLKQVKGLSLPDFIIKLYEEHQEQGKLEQYIGKNNNPIITKYYLDYLEYMVLMTV
ncbi:hypothetical protein [Viridibacillus arvi]|uniref:hypothetical protein n=1 Tax=Viridibacillus arvi TaxID=263475 RepID=UPI0034CE8EE3